MSLADQLRDPHGPLGVRLVAAAAVAAGTLVTVSVAAGIAVSRTPAPTVDDAPLAVDAPDPGGATPTSDGGTAPTATPSAAATDRAVVAAPGDAGTEPAGAATEAADDTTTSDPDPGDAPAPTTSRTAAGDRTGVTDTSIAWGVHGPLTISGAPLNIAEDPINGLYAYVEYINGQGGVHGRQIDLTVVDDGYTVDYARRASDQLINEQDNFLVSGTLGVDQIAVVATEAQKRGVPYLAAGGSESHFASLDIHQYGVSYNTALLQLARYLATDPRYVGKNIGVTVLDSPLFDPALADFLAAAEDAGVKVTAVEPIQKPDQQTSYVSQIQGLKEGLVEVVVPIHDPVSTSRIVAECRVQLCTWDWTFANFVHDTDTALALMQGDWTGVRGLSFFCSHVHRNAENPARCAAMGKAHEQWAAIRGEDDWQENGQSGAFGYQGVYAWVGAARAAGADLTRERFLAALHRYDDYSDLITGPITFRGRSTYGHGAEEFVVLEAQSNLKWQQVSPGLSNDF